MQPIEFERSGIVPAPYPEPTAWANPVWHTSTSRSDVVLEAQLALFRHESRRTPGARARLNRPLGAPHLIVPLPPRPTGALPEFVFSRTPRTAYSRGPSDVALEDLVFAHPRRDFSRRPHQQHRPIAHYSNVVADLVMCESQLERAFVLVADFTSHIVHIVSQPVTILFPDSSDFHWHTPDFLVLRHGAPPLVVDVKRPEQAVLPAVIARHTLAAQMLALAGLQYTVWTGIPPTTVENLLVMHRSELPIDPARLRTLGELVAGWARAAPISVADAIQRLAHQHNIPATVGMRLVRHLLYLHYIRTDLAALITPDSELTA